MNRMISAALLGVFFSSQSFAEVVVVVNPQNSATLSAKSVQRIFLGKVTEYSTGEEPLVINQAPGTAQRTEFDQNILGRSTAQVTASLAKLVFTGRGVMPTEVESDSEVIDLIKQDQQAIGYIDASSLTNDVKVVNID
ncbi:phosphate ABC transporter substrate-binding protein [Alteromonas halophila]|uniref:Phosphate ABC transporter substrate-binding protein n=1 Tax=Alteromonas halophila TaxID=516698 RepID=A0A918JHZ2_9ALTE|nr:phosphate ABC transporter substrate-binding protein [Alteromonas halophila]GGW81631.1 hypothetical protein GCM10007391_13560 [Alteromonas halophila]